MSMVPLPAIKRLCTIYNILDNTLDKKNTYSSEQLAEMVGTSSDTIRKDFTYLNTMSSWKSGYPVLELLSVIEINLISNSSNCPKQDLISTSDFSHWSFIRLIRVIRSIRNLVLA